MHLLLRGRCQCLNHTMADCQSADGLGSMQSNASTSPIPRLPSEIRNRILKLVFTQQERPCLRSVSHYHKANAVPGQPESVHYGGYLHVTQHFRPWAEMSLQLQVLRVSRQIYAEAALLPFALNNFSCEHPPTLESSTPVLSLCKGRLFKSPYALVMVVKAGLG